MRACSDSNCWGQGYRLSKEFYDYFEEELSERKPTLIEN